MRRRRRPSPQFIGGCAANEQSIQLKETKVNRISYLMAVLVFPLVALAQVAPLTNGEVRKVDKEAGKITLKHGPIENLEMPAMTMVFRVKEPAMLEEVKTGDKVRFAAQKVNGALTVTQIEVAK